MRKKPAIQSIIVLLVVIGLTLPVLAGAQKKKKEILFPKREYVRRHSEIFFKAVSMNSPVVEKVVFFAKSEAYLSAYMAFSPYLIKHPWFRKLIPVFEAQNKELIQQFREHSKKINIENYGTYPGKLNADNLKIYLLVMHAIIRDYHENTLSGDAAFRYWNILFHLTQKAYKDKSKTPVNAAILTASSHLVFFKKHKKWQKKAGKILKKARKTKPLPQDIEQILTL